MGNKTALYQAHLDANAKIVDFGGWEMPLHYGSQLEEHQQVRNDAGVFDVSHMTIIDVTGDDGHRFLRYVLANDVARLDVTGKALYTTLLNEQGGIIDDLIVYLMTGPQADSPGYRIVVNCATRSKVLAWLQQQVQSLDVHLTERSDLAMLAIQGPNAISRVKAAVGQSHCDVINSLDSFQGLMSSGHWFIARTGYTGEEGLEIMLPQAQAVKFWQALIQAGVNPIGLAARDTLRLEAGMNLYSVDMNEDVTPLESNIGWSVAFKPKDRDFIGRKALEQQKEQGLTRRLVGLVLPEKAIMRSHYKVTVAGSDQQGEITSGLYSPTLGYSIALARIPVTTDKKVDVSVLIRGKQFTVTVVKPPFVRNGKRVYK